MFSACDVAQMALVHTHTHAYTHTQTHTHAQSWHKRKPCIFTTCTMTAAWTTGTCLNQRLVMYCEFIMDKNLFKFHPLLHLCPNILVKRLHGAKGTGSKNKKLRHPELNFLHHAGSQHSSFVLNLNFSFTLFPLLFCCCSCCSRNSPIQHACFTAHHTGNWLPITQLTVVNPDEWQTGYPGRHFSSASLLRWRSQGPS